MVKFKLQENRDVCFEKGLTEKSLRVGSCLKNSSTQFSLK